MTYQTKAAVTRALTRDTGLRNAPWDRQGYHVRGGGSIPVSFYADVTDHVSSKKDVDAAAGLAEALTEKGWDVRHDEERVIVIHAPTIAEQRKKGLA